MEENKVAQKLRQLITTALNEGYFAGGVTDAVLKSSDLRVTLVEPKYSLQTFGGNMTTVERDGKWIATFDSRADAEAFKNSKEPK